MISDNLVENPSNAISQGTNCILLVVNRGTSPLCVLPSPTPTTTQASLPTSNTEFNPNANSAGQVQGWLSVIGAMLTGIAMI